MAITRRMGQQRGLYPSLFVIHRVGDGVCGGGDGSDTVIGPDEPVHIRTLLSHGEAWSSGDVARIGVEMAVEDFGRVYGHEVELGPALNSMCSPEGGRTGAEQIVPKGALSGSSARRARRLRSRRRRCSARRAS